jgi:hypothetical protein
MPVPFPTADTVKLDRPDAEEVRVMVGGVAAAIAPDGQLTGLQKLLVEAMTESMTGFVVPAGHVPRLDPEQFARAMANRDANFRQRMLQFMLLGSLVLVPLPDEVIRRVEAYADELGVQNDMLRIAHRFSKGSLGLALIDFERSGYMQKWAEEHKNPLHTSGELEEAWQQCSRDPELVARWEALRALPEGTLGREVAKFYDARGFAFPVRPVARRRCSRSTTGCTSSATTARRSSANWKCLRSSPAPMTIRVRSPSLRWSFPCSRPDTWRPVRACSNTTAAISRTKAWRSGSPTQCGAARCALRTQTVPTSLPTTGSRKRTGPSRMSAPSSASSRRVKERSKSVR